MIQGGGSPLLFYAAKMKKFHTTDEKFFLDKRKEMWYNGRPAFICAPAIFTITFHYTIFLRESQEAKQTNKNPKTAHSLYILPIAAKQKI